MIHVLCARGATIPSLMEKTCAYQVWGWGWDVVLLNGCGLLKGVVYLQEVHKW